MEIGKYLYALDGTKALLVDSDGESLTLYYNGKLYKRDKSVYATKLFDYPIINEETMFYSENFGYGTLKFIRENKFVISFRNKYPYIDFYFPDSILNKELVFAEDKKEEEAKIKLEKNEKKIIELELELKEEREKTLKAEQRNAELRIYLADEKRLSFNKGQDVAHLKETILDLQTKNTVLQNRLKSFLFPELCKEENSKDYIRINGKDYIYIGFSINNNEAIVHYKDNGKKISAIYNRDSMELISSDSLNYIADEIDGTPQSVSIENGGEPNDPKNDIKSCWNCMLRKSGECASLQSTICEFYKAVPFVSQSY